MSLGNGGHASNKTFRDTSDRSLPDWVNLYGFLFSTTFVHLENTIYDEVIFNFRIFPPTFYSNSTLCISNLDKTRKRSYRSEFWYPTCVYPLFLPLLVSKSKFATRTGAILFVHKHYRPDIMWFLTTDSGEKLSHLSTIHRIIVFNWAQLNLLLYFMSSQKA